MKTLLWKEVRENFKWAMLAMVGLGLAEVYGLYYFDPFNWNNRGTTLCNPTFLMATSFGNALVGLLLGLVQILPEQRRDQWAALLHRPVSRGVIYRGKAFAGLALYLMATLPPFLLCLYLAATPGHFVAPFVPKLMLASVSDICVGAVYYFAALTLALQRGSWFGARVLALLAAVYVSFSMSGMHYFYVVVEASLIMGALLFTAAWGAMLSNGRFDGRPWLTQAALLISAFYGTCSVGMLLNTMGELGSQPQPQTGVSYVITQDGLPLILNVKPDLSKSVTDLAGNIVQDDKLTSGRSYQNQIFIYNLTSFIGNDHGFRYSGSYYNYRLSYEYVSEIQVNELQPVQWFFLNEQRYAVGIDRQRKAPSVVVDRTGFHAPGLALVPFTGTESHWYETPALVQEGNDAFEYDLEKEKISLLPTDDPTPIRGMQMMQYEPANGKGYDVIIVVARDRGLQVYDSKGVTLLVIPYAPQVDLDRFGSVMLGINSHADRFYVEYAPSAWLQQPEKDRMPTYLDEVDAKGQVLHSYILPALPRPPYLRSWSDYVSLCLRAPGFWYWDLAYQKIGAALGIESLQGEANYSFNTHWGETKDASLHLTLCALVFAVVALAWARGAGMSWRRAWAWSGFVMTLNLGGLITFYLVADWPVRVRCPQCHRPRKVEEMSCAHCDAGWPEPARRGVEIFDADAPDTVGGEG